MNIFEELNSVDKKMKDDLDEFAIRRKELEKRKKEEGISKFEKLMTGRERKIATVTGKIKKVTNASSLACGCHCTGIVNIEKVGRELTCDEKIKLDAVRKK